MEVDPMESVERADEDGEAEASPTQRKRDRLNSWVAITIALLVTFTGICKVKDDNIVQAMQQAQADKIDQWSFYQARNIREEVAAASAVQLRLQRATAPANIRAAYDSAIARYDSLVRDQHDKRLKVRADAEQSQKSYDALNYRDDQFDLSDALIAIAVSMLAMTALTHKRWLYYLALVPTLLGVLMGLAGLLAWHLHPDAIARWLS
ncbi:MAG: DUF4337 domain-containing protein [Gemmatimonadota bacterium]|nr:DUF4337 domain-containing protein [Gemmatimonadota bacterium]